MQLPKISVCVVTYNHEHYLRPCLQSIVEQQVHADLEIIVSDDCSTDRTRGIIAEFHANYPTKIKPVFLEKNIGAFANFIRTHALATGDYVCHCDGDDYFLEGKLQKQLDIFNTERLCTAVWHRVDFFNDGGFFCSGKTADISPFKDGVVTLEKAVRLGYVSVHSSLMYRRAAQRFTPHVKSDIIDLFRTFDLLSAGYGKVLPDILGRYRVDASGSLTSNAMAKVRQLQVQHARFFYKEFPAMRQSFFIFAVSKLLVDALHLRKTTWDLLKFASTCFCFVSPIKVIENLRDMRRIQVG